MHKPVCIPCQVELRCHKVGVAILDTAGKDQRPYKLWSADLWKCPNCGILLAVRFANNPHAHGFQEQKMQKLIALEVSADNLYYNHEYPTEVDQPKVRQPDLTVKFYFVESAYQASFYDIHGELVGESCRDLPKQEPVRTWVLEFMVAILRTIKSIRRGGSFTHD